MRRYRQGTTWGSVSQRERWNADDFLTDLVGRGNERSSSSRRNADLFLESLLGKGNLRPVGSDVARASEATYAEAPDLAPTVTVPTVTVPTVTVKEGRDKDEIIVTRADGTRFHVRRKVRAQVLTRPGRPRAGFCKDDRRVFLRASWCEGTSATIDLGANPQGAFKDLMDKVFDQFKRGETIDQIKQTFEDASIQTFLDIDIEKAESWKITGAVKLDFNRNGLASTSANLSFDRGWIKLGAEYEDGADGKQVLVKVDIPLSARKVKGKECPPQELALWWDVECLREVPTSDTLQSPGLIEKRECLFLYFDHARDTLRADPKFVGAQTTAEQAKAIVLSTPSLGTARLNRGQLERLDYLVGQRYWVTSINGYTSPEGRRRPPGPGDRGAAARWEGNDALSDERADKVRKLIRNRYDLTLQMRSPRMHFPPGKHLPDSVGRSEEPRLDDRLGAELEGRDLDRAILFGDKKLGVPPFLVEHPEELARMTPEDRKFVTNPDVSVRARAERLFENLRRVEICLKHSEPVRGPVVKSFYLQHEPTCPDDLIEAAERQWGSRIPFTKPDPPLCG